MSGSIFNVLVIERDIKMSCSVSEWGASCVPNLELITYVLGVLL